MRYRLAPCVSSTVSSLLAKVLRWLAILRRLCWWLLFAVLLRVTRLWLGRLVLLLPGLLLHTVRIIFPKF